MELENGGFIFCFKKIFILFVKMPQKMIKKVSENGGRNWIMEVGKSLENGGWSRKIIGKLRKSA